MTEERPTQPAARDVHKLFVVAASQGRARRLSVLDLQNLFTTTRLALRLRRKVNYEQFVMLQQRPSKKFCC